MNENINTIVSAKRTSTYTRFAVYLAIVILINIAGITAFFRFDMTRNGVYSLSPASKKVVKTLKSPLTVKVFFTKNLEHPYNNVERYLKDLLREYSIQGKNFNYKFYDVSPKDSGENAEVEANKKLARDYGIYPVQIQVMKDDEAKMQNAYLGMVFIHGDVIEKINTITMDDYNRGLEYRITGIIQKLNNKISALQNLSGKIQVKLFLSSALSAIGPNLGIANINDVKTQIKEAVDKLNEENYNALEFSHLDTSTNPELKKEADRYKIPPLQWPNMPTMGGKTIPAGEGRLGLIIEYAPKYESITLLQHNPLARLIGGSPYQITKLDDLKDKLNDMIQNLIDINENIGYLSSHDTVKLSSYNMPGMPQQQQNDTQSASHFNSLLSSRYSVKEVDLQNDPIPESLECLIIAGPRGEFSDYELFQIDQFLMKGKSLALFLDALNEIQPPRQQRQMGYGQGPQYIPINTGLRRLLNHYGLDIKAAYACDEDCYKQRQNPQYGGGERPFYFAPFIRKENLSKTVPFVKDLNITERPPMILLKISPLEIFKDTIEKNKYDLSQVLSTSEKGWETEGRINFMYMRPPSDESKMKKIPLAYTLEGEFTSFFAGKEIPVKKVSEEEKKNAKKSKIDLSKMHASNEIIEKGKRAKIFVMGSSEQLKNQLIDPDGYSMNSIFILNTLDYLNNHLDYAVMRSKSQSIPPLNQKARKIKNFVKIFNYAGLPLLVALIGLLIFLRRAARKRSLQQQFGAK